MTTPIVPRDEQWLRALEARRDALDLRVPAADEALYKDLQRRLDEERPQHYAKTSWKRTLGFALAAFALGVVVARFAMLSSAPAVRSMGPSSPEASPVARSMDRDRGVSGRAVSRAAESKASSSPASQFWAPQRPTVTEPSHDLQRGTL